MNIELKLETFEGPLDLLLHLIERSEIDLYEISIAEVTQQYMEVLAEMQRLELDVASEFLVMASTLLAMKSKMLLPKPEPDTFQPGFDMDVEDEVDPRQELFSALWNINGLNSWLKRQKKGERTGCKAFTRIPADLQAFIPEKEPNPVKDVSVYDLAKAFQSILANKKKCGTDVWDQAGYAFRQRARPCVAHLTPPQKRDKIYETADGPAERVKQ